MKSLALLTLITVLALTLSGCHSSPQTNTTSGPSSAAPKGGVQTKTSGCLIHAGLPDSACTPGALLATGTKEAICTPGYASSVGNVPKSVKE